MMKRYLLLLVVLFSTINVQCATAYQEGLIKLNRYCDYIFHVTNAGTIADPLGSFRLYDWPNTTDAYGNVCTSPTVAYNPSTYKSFCTYDYVLTQTVFDFSSGISLPITINGRTFTDVITDTYTGTDQFAAVYGWKYLTLWFYDRADNPTITTSSAANHSVIVKGQGMSCKLNPGYTTNNSLANCVTYSYGTTSISINNVGILNAKSSQDMYCNSELYFAQNVIPGVAPKLTITATPSAGGKVDGVDMGCNFNYSNVSQKTFGENEEVLITAIPAPGYTFLYWQEGGSRIVDNPYLVSMAADKSLVAVFIPILKFPLSGTLDNRALAHFTFSDEWTYGECPTGVYKKHVGVDLSASATEEVQAAYAGTIKNIFTGQHSQWADAIVLESNGGQFTTVYWHVIKYGTLSVGSTVTKGQKIATVADLGSNTHFHFGFRMGGYDSSLSLAGALPTESCGTSPTYPAFPENFIDPSQLAFE